jgi:TolB-like protein
MGEVYRARDPKLGRDVAVKVLGVPYIVSELLEGETLRQRLSTAAVPVRKAIDYAVQIAQGLAAAHEKGILHRDVKPANLFLTRDGRVKILDFGLAKLRGPRLQAELPVGEQDTVSQTSPGIALGTASYMSPEQVRGDPVDTRSDIFSFGAVLYEMLSRQRAFRGETAVETLNAILNEDPPALSSANPALSPVLERIVNRCLEKQPEDRFHSAHDIGIALQALCGSAGEVPWGGAPFPAARPRWRMWKVALAAGLVGVLLALALGLNLGGLRDRLQGGAGPRAIDSIAVLPLENLSGDPEQEYFSDGMTEVLIAELAKIEALRVISRQSVIQFRASERPLPEIARTLNVDALVEGSVLRSGGRVRITIRLLRAGPEQLLWAESYERDLRNILGLQGVLAREISRAVQATVTPEEDARLAGTETVDPEAHDAYLKGLYFFNQGAHARAKAAEYFQQAREVDPDYAPAYAKLAECHAFDGMQGDRAPMEAWADAETAALEALKLDDTLAEAHIALAEVSAHRDWDWTATERQLSRALSLKPSYAIGHFRHAAHLIAMGRFDEGIARSRRAQALEPLTPFFCAYMATNLYWARRYDESIAEARKALELDPKRSWAHGVLGMSYGQKGMPEEAIAALQKAGYKGALGHAYALAGRREEALRLLQELRSASRPRLALAWEMAGLLGALGEKDEALDLLERAFEERLGRVVWIDVEPRLDPLRDDRRFQALVRRLNLPE